MRRPHRFFSLSRPKLRQSWNKFNLWNLYRGVGRQPGIKGRPTFFQQKWRAKSITRAYHGEHIPEKKWARMFSRRLLSVIDLPPKYLAAHDGSEQAAGRGSGLTTSTVTAESYSNLPKFAQEELHLLARGSVNKLLLVPIAQMTPYMQMTYAPLERRLDTAVFRALFASSVRQARQFIIHGAVKVNGKKMVHPSYLLNPGDMYQVDVDRVMYATGEQRKGDSHQKLRKSLELRKQKSDKFYNNISDLVAKGSKTEQLAGGGQEAPSSDKDVAAGTAQSDEAPSPESDATLSSESDEATKPEMQNLTPEETWTLNGKTLKYLLKDVKRILGDNRKELTAKDKRLLRLFRADTKRILARPDGDLSGIDELLEELQSRMKSHELMRDTLDKFAPNRLIKAEQAENEQPAENEQQGEEQAPRTNQRQVDKALRDLTEEQKEKAKRIMGSTQLSAEEIRRLAALLKEDAENPMDESKPYATPWRPRAYMAPFAFIPRYLEVNPNICAAVYLRHPVARRGMAEVPTPFNYLTNQLAHNWYLRRR